MLRRGTSTNRSLSRLSPSTSKGRKQMAAFRLHYPSSTKSYPNCTTTLANSNSSQTSTRRSTFTMNCKTCCIRDRNSTPVLVTFSTRFTRVSWTIRWAGKSRKMTSYREWAGFNSHLLNSNRMQGISSNTINSQLTISNNSNNLLHTSSTNFLFINSSKSLNISNSTPSNILNHSSSHLTISSSRISSNSISSSSKIMDITIQISNLSEFILFLKNSF